MSEILSEFFAVTLTSIYKVRAHGDNGELSPYAEKIAIKGESSFPLGHRIDDGSMIAITKSLQAFVPEGHGLSSAMASIERKIENVNIRYWCSGTSPIVGLFLTEEEAVDCFSQSNLEPYDSRWRRQIKEVIDRIGDEHPTICICHHPDLALIVD